MRKIAATMDDDTEPLVFSTAGREFMHQHPTSTHNARGNTLGDRARAAFGRGPSGGNGAWRRGQDVPLNGGTKRSGAKNDGLRTPTESAGVFGEDLSPWASRTMIVCAVILVVVAATYTGFIVRQRHRISKFTSQVALPQLALRDPVTGLVCATCDTGTGDIVIADGTVFLGADGTPLMPDAFTDECMTCSSDAGADLHRAVKLMQDEHVPTDTNGATVYPYGHAFQTSTGAAEDGGEPRQPYYMRTTSLDVRTGIMSFSRYAMGQSCPGTTCSVTYEQVTDAVFAGPTTGFPDMCSGTTDATMPENSMYLIHRDMAASVEFVTGGMDTLGFTTDNFDSTFVHLCACIVSPIGPARTQYCTSPFIGSYGGSYNEPGFPVVR